MAVDNNVKKVKGSAASGSGFIGFLKELLSEHKRITWASKDKVKKATITVMIFCVVCIVIVGVLDFGFNNLFKLVFK
ncbi:preprotein translocase subunit SecE [Clostridium fermenticellae]|uniref:Protein translocase subunit SecE n=1 Tax=Clostridium fermenticellae TaxID=2068654 RepID=A0A386H0P6_9CLOT|nr:preprotein translocase subunit SecE [Clostridium fermenticellae]AYD39239.1 preprotein translocase subunit SecE [Clostridium fermenticellae]